MSPFELDRHVHRDLRRLPPPPAPRDFTARVLAARARLDARPWYARGWSAWPVQWQVASGAALAVSVTLLGLLMPWAYEGIRDLAVRVVTEQAPGLRAGVVTAETVWLAGGGIRGGMVYGSTDELGYAAVEDVSTVHDLHATMLHQLGIRHDAFSVKFQGLDARLSGVENPKVITKIVS